MTIEELRNTLSARFDFNLWMNLLGEMFPKVEFFTQINQIQHELVKRGGQVGIIRLDDGRALAIYKFEVSDNVLINRNKRGLRDIAAKTIDQSIVHGVLAFYYSENVVDYRLTYIAKQTSFSENGELITKETAPKRYTFLLGKNESCRTAAIRLNELLTRKKNGSVYLADVTEAFSVERLNKDFFKEYKTQYVKFVQYIFDTKQSISGTKQSRDYVKKLLGRLVFLQFLQKKGWMGVPASYSKWEGGDKDYLYHLVIRNEGNNRLLSDVLEVLFFNTLNEKRTNDIADLCLGENIKIPYLNGGLFEKDKVDALDIDFPYPYFKELMEFFSRYNFTIDENDPDDSEVGIDPEMLGHIFENLLEDNKDKGAFYTPKEIVQYMCRQSIIQYLKAHVSDEQYAQSIVLLINDGIVMPEIQNRKVALQFIQLLKNVKVCDPAIGSGAFPMGIFYVLYHAIHHLQSHAEPNKSFDSTQTKCDIIQNNIFGVDIEQGAVDIARLRFWLALVVDSEEPQPLPNLDYKIVCGNSLLSRNNLSTPILSVFTNYNKDKTNDKKITLQNYQRLVDDYINTSDHSVKNKYKELITDIKSYFKTSLDDKLRFYSPNEKKLINKYHMYLDLSSKMNDIFNDNYDESKLSAKAKQELDKIRNVIEEKKQLVNSVKFDRLYHDAFEWRYEFPSLLDSDGNFTGFDLVIGNPPYLRLQGIRDKNPDFADELVRTYKSTTGSFDLYVTFVERGLQIINKNGIVNYIMPIKWTNAAYGKGLRALISDKKAASKFINFGAYQVFNASTYTALQWFVPNSSNLLYSELDRDLVTSYDLNDYLIALGNKQAARINPSKLNKEPWVLTVGYTSDILGRLESNSRKVEDIFQRIFCGLQTSKDDVYFLYDCVEDNNIVCGYSKYLKRNIHIERGLVKPLLKGEDVHKYDCISTNRFVIFPYKLENGKANLYSEIEIADSFPLGYAYLKECEDVLRGREKARLINDEFWFRYIYPKNLIMFNNEKLVAPDISMGGNYAYDSEGVFYQTTTVYGYIKKDGIKESYKFWMALFNSHLFWWYLKNTGTVLANGFFRFKPDYVNPFPIPEIINDKVERIVTILCDYLLLIKNSKNDISDLVSNKTVFDYFNRVLDACIYEMYFEEHMKKLKINIINTALELIKPITHLSSLIEQKNIIWDVFLILKKTDNEIRNRLELLTLRSPDILKHIIEE